MTDDPRLSGPDEKSISPSRTGVDTVIRVLRAESAAIADAAAGVGPDLESVLPDRLHAALLRLGSHTG